MNSRMEFTIIALGFVLSLLLTVSSFVFLVHLVQKTRKQEPEKDQGVLVVCKKCGGTGEMEQDVNLLMTQASIAIWQNIHVASDKCAICSDERLCDTAREKHDELMGKYKELGPKVEMANCPGCMGMGSYTQFKGYRFGREKP